MFIKFHTKPNFPFIFSATSFNIFTILHLKTPTIKLAPHSSTRLLIHSQSKLFIQILLILPRIHLWRFNHTNTHPTTQNPLKPPTTGLFPAFSPPQTTSHCWFWKKTTVVKAENPPFYPNNPKNIAKSLQHAPCSTIFHSSPHKRPQFPALNFYKTSHFYSKPRLYHTFLWSQRILTKNIKSLI